ncbi:hypothetical protein L1987_21923 [Smallanthus sonchifolius]|uniref:Uncharacterized protein n=1 Tax=Smallanthus sonchifolius TaxID=185202 RepID=A0ACB9ICS0_9ASTR|nr:hypothetical protein L1987_21923 [Smallanthus sonchifolius]
MPGKQNEQRITAVGMDDHRFLYSVALSIHCLLDYFDRPKLQAIGGGSMTSTTLYQTTGNVVGETGFVNITDLVGGSKFGFGSGGTGSRLDALYERSVKQIPYNLSVLEISSPVTVSGILKAPLRSDANITTLLEKAGCKTFANLISDVAVKASGLPECRVAGCRVAENSLARFGVTRVAV